MRTRLFRAAGIVLGTVLLAGCGSATVARTATRTPGKVPQSSASAARHTPHVTTPVRSTATTPKSNATTTPSTTPATGPTTPKPSAQTTSPTIVKTRVRVFTPFHADGTPSVPVTRTRAGTCWTSSVAAPVRGAYRCFGGNEILDPCFVASEDAAGVLCLTSPWATAQKLTLRAALPADAPGLDATRPWALELANGARCVAVTGTAPAVAGVSLAYSCGKRHGAALITSRGSLLTAHYAKFDDSALRTIGVAVAWRA